MPLFLSKLWDGGPVRVDRTVREGDSVAGFEVVHFPGHAPGLIGLWRARDRLMLASDAFYTIDPLNGADGAPRIPHPGLNQDRQQARDSLRKLAAMEPAAAWAGHGQPVTGDVRGQLETAAETT
jgi:glyoxylase-like metal-dependent hydrolase (beta-lactamase superfamily II)